MLKAVLYCHNQDIVFKYLNPTNILVDKEDDYKLKLIHLATFHANEP